MSRAKPEHTLQVDKLNDKQVQALQPGKRIVLSGGRGYGSLVVRRTPTSTLFYFRGGSDGRMVPMGKYPEVTCADAFEKFNRLKVQHHDSLAGRAAPVGAAEAAAKVEAKTAAEAEQHTLADMCALYVRLKRADAGKSVATFVDYQATLDRAAERDPGLFKSSARTVQPEAIATHLHQLVEAGKHHEARKLRAILAAAYGMASRAKVNAEARPFAPFAVASNPARETDPPRLPQRIGVDGRPLPAGKRDKHKLADKELRAYLAATAEMPDSVRRFAVAHLLLGGQRQFQLMRARVDDVDLKAKTIALFSTKGKGSALRQHDLPLSHAAMGVIKEAIEAARKAGHAYLFLPLATATREDLFKAERAFNDAFTGYVDRAAIRLKKGGEATRTFSPSHLRSTAVSRLQEKGVADTITDRLSGHGPAGVMRYYDQSDLRAQFRKALAVWETILGVQKAGQKSVAPTSEKRGPSRR